MPESPDRSRGVKRKRSRHAKNVRQSPAKYGPFDDSNDDCTSPDEDALLIDEIDTKMGYAVLRQAVVHPKRTIQDIFAHITQILWFILVVSCFIGISMMPGKYMGTTKDRQHERCAPGASCTENEPHALDNIAMYDPSKFEEFPLRKNIHDRHNHVLISNHHDPQSLMESFLHPKLPRDYMSRIPAPEAAVEDPGLQYPWQTPGHWAYPASLTSGNTKKISEQSTGENFGVSAAGIPNLAHEECLKRSDIPWDPKRKPKTYIKGGIQGNYPGQHVHIKHVHEFSKSFSSHRYGFDNRMQVWDSPVAMAGEISVVPANPASREVKKNEIGVEFKATLSDREIYEAIYMRKIDNGTVVLETLGAHEANEACFDIHIVVTVPPRINIPSLTIRSLMFPISIQRDVSLHTERLDLFAKKGSIGSWSRNITVSDSVVLGVQDGTITGYFPLANSLQADCEKGLIDIITKVMPNDRGKRLNNNPVITTSIGTGALKLTLEGPIPPDRLEIRSSHVAATGSQRISYPSDWQGTISGQGQVGTCDIHGRGLEIVEARNNNTGLNVYVKAVKGPSKYDGADTSIELREGPVVVGIGDPSGWALVGSWGFNTETIGGIWKGLSVGLVLFFWLVSAMAGYGYLFG